jgi:hypothetical protein
MCCLIHQGHFVGSGEVDLIINWIGREGYITSGMFVFEHSHVNFINTDPCDIINAVRGSIPKLVW